MALTVRRLQIVDLPTLERTEAERDQRFKRPGALATFRKLVEETLSAEPEGLMVADLDGRVAGLAIARQRGNHPSSGRPHGRVEYLAVTPGFETLGITARLVREAEAYLRSRGCTALHVLLPADDTGDAGLFKSTGYQVVAWELEKLLG